MLYKLSMKLLLAPLYYRFPHALMEHMYKIRQLESDNTKIQRKGEDFIIELWRAGWISNKELSVWGREHREYLLMLFSLFKLQASWSLFTEMRMVNLKYSVNSTDQLKSLLRHGLKNFHKASLVHAWANCFKTPCTKSV